MHNTKDVYGRIKYTEGLEQQAGMGFRTCEVTVNDRNR